MRRFQKGIEQPLSGNPATLDKALLRAGVFSLLLHITLVIILSLNVKSTITNMGPSVYRVTLRPFSPHGDGTPLGRSIPGLPGSPRGLPASQPGEKIKPVEKSRTTESKKGEVPYVTKKQKSNERVTRNEITEGLKRSQKEKSYKHLQEAIEEIDKKAALDQIQKRVDRREKLEKGSTEGQSTTHLSQESKVSGSGTGTGSGTGSGSGSAGSPTGGSPWGSPFGGSSALESKLNDYYNMIWSKIKKGWALPGDLPKGKTNLETIIVIVIEREGKIQKSWFEKMSGNALYDKSTMRAIKKAEPLPPIPKEFSDNTLEMGFRFYPD
jgi:TonB family protein